MISVWVRSFILGVVVVTNLWFQSVDCKDICEGFIKSGVPLDLSQIQITLLTKDGNLKYETSCNPQNGYFMIPVFKNKGNYKLKLNAPTGWIFEPDVQEINIDENGSCGEEIIYFSLLGFTISGAVLSGGVGPENFQLSLFDSGGKAISTALTRQGGVYEFQAKPGKYMVSTDAGSSQCIEQGKISVEVLDGPIVVKPDILISGYNLKIAVKDFVGSPLPKATITLSSNIDLQFDNSPINSERPRGRKEGSKWLYSLQSDDDNGVAHFYCLPPEKYSVKAEFSNDALALNFEPEEKFVKISLQADEVTLQASTFDIRGVIASGPNPIGGVEISVNDAKKTVTDAKGNYQLTQMKEGTYRLSASKDNFEFKDIKRELSFSQFEPLDFHVKRIAVCGVVEFDLDTKKKSDENSVELFIKAEGGEKFYETVTVTERENKFCRLLTPGIYSITPLTQSMSFAPKSKEVDLRYAPQLGLKFTQFKASISGKVICIETCKNVVIQLVSEERVLQEKSTNSVFQFSDVPAGTYTAQIRDDYNFWWEQSEQTLQVVDKDVNDVTFKQSGYFLEIHISHPADLKYSSVPQAKDVDAKVVKMMEGLNKIFFDKAGKYSFTLDSCHQFSNKGEQIQLNVPSVERMVLEAKSSLTTVSITTNGPSTDEKFRILISDAASSKEFSVEETSVSDKNNHSFVFTLDRDAIGHKFTITPKSDKYLFRPLSVSYGFTGECASNVANFKAEIGKTIKGVVKPAVSNIQVQAVHSSDETVLTSETNSNGHYSVGPVWNMEDYSISLIKEGYEFTKDSRNPFNFKATKLSHLKILFVDSDSKKPLADVLVSLSGAIDYRSNNIVDNTGIIHFVGLPTGEYFLQAILQEYKFDSSSTKVTVTEGETQELTLTAKKFAYSAFGKVTTINKLPINEILHVEGVSEQCNNHQEEDTTKAKSSEFRLRGLRPDCRYRVTLKDESGQKVISYPPFIDVITQNEDKHGLNFIITQVETQTTVFGKIIFDGVEPPTTSYRIGLIQNHETIHEVIIQSPVSVFMFQNLTLNNGIYSVGFDHSEARKFKIEPSSGTVNFVSDSTFKHVNIVVKPEKRAAEVEVSQANYFGFALLILLTLAFLNQSKTKMIWERIKVVSRQFIQQNTNGAENTHGGDGSGDRKRKPKKA